MFIIEIANLKIQIINKYKYLRLLCKDYIIDSSSSDFSVSVTDEEIIEEAKVNPIKQSNPYLESICIYRKIAFNVLKYDAFLIHGSAIKIDNNAYLFCAKSGIGKTTHTMNLKTLLGDKLTFINGDKPIIRLINNTPVVFGSPWCGKENYGSNTFAPLKAIVFLERSEENIITNTTKKEIIKKLLKQILVPSDVTKLDKTFDLLNKTLDNVKLFNLKCTKELDSAKISYDAIKNCF